jgi:hypothetical protein
MATYKEIQIWVRQQYGFVPQNCWIAHVKEISGLRLRRAPNRQGTERVRLCPQEKVELIQAALRYSGMLPIQPQQMQFFPTAQRTVKDTNMPSIALTVGAGSIDRVIPNADDLLRQYRSNTGCFYLDYRPVTPPDKIVPEDLAVTLLVNSQFGWRAFYSLMEHGSTIDLSRLPQKPLEHTSAEERVQIAALIAQMAQLPGFAASVATKVLHKKRPELIPILDNQAIFGAYLNSDWNPPSKPARSDSIKSQDWICKALDWIAFDLNRPENSEVWSRLQAIEPARSRIQLFDSVWWMYFRKKQPVVKREGE